MAFALGTHTVVLHRRVPVLDGSGNPTFDAYGRAIVTEVDDTVTGCDFRATQSLETESSVTVARLDGEGMLPPGAPVDYTSSVTWNGITFEVHGPPRPIANIRDTAIDHIEISGRSSLSSGSPGSREEG